MKKAYQSGELPNIEKLAEMSSQERRDLFSKFIDDESAKGVNAGFENALTGESARAMKTWVERTFSSKEKKSTAYKDILTKIDDLNKKGLLTPESERKFMEDLVTEKLGGTLSVDEARTIAEKSSKLQDLYSKVDALGDPYSDHKAQLDYFKARRDMEDYIDSLNPQSKLRVASSTIARGNMLFRLGSILVNINSNNLQGSLEAVVRRFETRSVKGFNNKAVSDVVKFNAQVFKETGFDLSRMTSLESERKLLGEEFSNAQGKGIVRKVGRVYQDLLFNLTQGLPDVVAASLAGGDRANLLSTRIALQKGLKGEAAKAEAMKIFRDSLRIEPQTKEGQLVKSNAVADALRSTNQDKRLFADRALKFRKILNGKDLRFGDVSIPFVKTTANAIQSSLEASGILVPADAIVRTIKMVKLVQNHEGSLGEVSREAFSGFGSSMVRAGLGTTAAFLVANAIDSNNYIGAYPKTSKEQELIRLRKATANSVNVGGHWVSLDWFGPLAAPLVGFLSAKKYGDNFQDDAANYFTGAGYQISRIPGMDFVTNTSSFIVDQLKPGGKQTATARMQDAVNYAVNFITSRAVPGFVSEFAQATDTVQRDVRKREDPTAPLKSAIPGLRETLPPKLSIFGETTPTEGWKQLILGGRFKTGKTDAVIEELVRLQDKNALPAIAPVDDPRDGVDRFQALKKQIGDEKYGEAVKSFGKSFHSGINDLLSNDKYKSADDSDKQYLINTLKKKLIDKTLDDYNFKEAEKQKRPKL